MRAKYAYERGSGKTFRVLMETLLAASRQDEKNIILWVANRFEVDRIGKALKAICHGYLTGVKYGPERLTMPNGVIIYIKNMQEVERETKGVSFTNYDEFMDPLNDMRTIDSFNYYMVKNGLL